MAALVIATLACAQTASAQWSIRVAWTAPGDDGTVGTAAEFDVRYSTALITDANWNLASQAANEPVPGPSGDSANFTIQNLQPLTTYYVAVKTRDEAYNWSPISNVVSKTTSLTTGIGEETLPVTFVLKQNYPNPFNPTTVIDWSMPTASHVSLCVYNSLGQLQRQLIDADMAAGNHSAFWNGRDDSDRPLPSGTYFYQLLAGPQRATHKMTLLK